MAAVGDLHCTRASQGRLQPLFARITESADLLLLAGDLTDHGHPDEAHVLARELAALRIPAVAVFGNHDYESGQQDEIREIITGAGATVLDGEACEVHGIGIVGVKGLREASDTGRLARGVSRSPSSSSRRRSTKPSSLKPHWHASARLRASRSCTTRHDTQQLGYLDARVQPLGGMVRREATIWTDAIKKDE